MSLLKNAKITRVAAAAAAAQTDVVGSILDMAGYDGVMFLALTGDVTASSVLTLKAQQNVANSGAGMADLVGTATFTADATNADSAVLALDVNMPRKRYVRAVLTRGAANAAVDGLIAIQYGARSKPTIHDASVIVQALIKDPNEA